MGDIREKLNIPLKFYVDKYEKEAVASNVGELIDILSELPFELAIDMGVDAGVMVCVYVSCGHESERCWVELKEIDPDWDESEDEDDDDA